MKSGFRNMKEEARAKARAMYEAANPISCPRCGRRFPTMKSFSEHRHSHIWDKRHAVKDLGKSSSQHQQIKGKSVRQPDVNPEKSIWKFLHVAGENGDGNKAAIPVGVKLQSTELKAPAESAGVDAADEVKEMDLDLNLHL